MPSSVRRRADGGTGVRRPGATPAPSIDRLIARAEDARDRAMRWLLDEYRSKGFDATADEGWFFYRAPWVFAMAGETRVAAAICAAVRDDLIGVDGRLRLPGAADKWSTYRAATFVVGAHLAGQYDLSFGTWRALLADREPDAGLFSFRAEASRSAVVDATADVAGCGFAAVAVGDLDNARSMSAFLDRLWEVQPDLPTRFFHNWALDRQATVTHDDPEFTPKAVLDVRLDAPQYWFLGGICAAFLTRLFLATGDKSLLEIARRYQSLAMGAADVQFGYPAACKGSWGSSLLYQATGDPAYLAYTTRMVEWYLQRQEPDGWWHPLVERTRGDVIEITLEFAMHLDTIVGALAG